MAFYEATKCALFQCVEEILGYLKSCFSREPTMATVCVQQVSNIFNQRLLSPGGAVCVVVVLVPALSSVLQLL